PHARSDDRDAAAVQRGVAAAQRRAEEIICGTGRANWLLRLGGRILLLRLVRLIHRFLEAADRLAERLSHLGKLARAEYHQRDDRDHDQFRDTESEHIGPLLQALYPSFQRVSN